MNFYLQIYFIIINLKYFGVVPKSTKPQVFGELNSLGINKAPQIVSPRSVVNNLYQPRSVVNIKPATKCGKLLIPATKCGKY